MSTTIRRLQSMIAIRARRQGGFTMIELMVVIAIVAILAALATPSFLPTIERWRVRSGTDDLQNSIYFARSEAVKRGGDVIMVRKASEGSCTSTGNNDWKCGWIVYHDANRDGNRAACPAGSNNIECPLQDVTISNSVTLTLSATNGGRLFFNRSGSIVQNRDDPQPLNLVQANVIAKDRTLTHDASRKLCVSGAGQLRRITGSQNC